MLDQNLPLPTLQLIMQMAAQNPKMMADLMASTGAAPPEVPANVAGNRATGVPAMGATPTAQASGQTQGLPAPTPAAPPMMPPGGALAGAVAPTVAPGPETLPAPGAPSPLQASGSINSGNLAQLMQMMMASQQKPTDRLSLGKAIQGY